MTLRQSRLEPGPQKLVPEKGWEEAEIPPEAAPPASASDYSLAEPLDRNQPWPKYNVLLYISAQSSHAIHCLQFALAL
jgi:hypothetical protein